MLNTRMPNAGCIAAGVADYFTDNVHAGLLK